MPFTDFIVDIIRNGSSIQQKINVEADAIDATKIAPARAIQLNGKPLANNNRLPTESLVKTSAGNPLQYKAIGTSAGAVIKGTSGSIYSVSCINLNTSKRYLQLFNKAVALDSVDVPIESFAVYGRGGQLILGQDYFTFNGLDFLTGIAWGISTTPLIYTAANPAETVFTARYL